MSAVATLAGIAVLLAAGCAVDAGSTPHCDAETRLAIVAQSVPDAAYVPCIDELPTGWSFAGMDVDHRGTTLSLESDRADRPSDISLQPSCDVTGATPIAPSDAGTRTYQLITSIDPRYAGRFLDVFAGGCIVTTYDFERGPHVALVSELQRAVDLRSRLELRQALLNELDVTLDP